MSINQILLKYDSSKSGFSKYPHFCWKRGIRFLNSNLCEWNATIYIMLTSVPLVKRLFNMFYILRRRNTILILIWISVQIYDSYVTFIQGQDWPFKHDALLASGTVRPLFVPVFAKAGGGGAFKLIRPSVCLSITKNFTLADIFWSFNDTALIFGMHDLCDKQFQLAMTLTFDLLKSQICCRAGNHNSPN